MNLPVAVSHNFDSWVFSFNYVTTTWDYPVPLEIQPLILTSRGVSICWLNIFSVMIWLKNCVTIYTRESTMGYYLSPCIFAIFTSSFLQLHLTSSSPSGLCYLQYWIWCSSSTFQKNYYIYISVLLTCETCLCKTDIACLVE